MAIHPELVARASTLSVTLESLAARWSRLAAQSRALDTDAGYWEAQALQCCADELNQALRSHANTAPVSSTAGDELQALMRRRVC